MRNLLLYSIVFRIVNQVTHKVSYELVKSVTSWIHCCHTLWWKTVD
jgi:hypothetical protein